VYTEAKSSVVNKKPHHATAVNHKSISTCLQISKRPLFTSTFHNPTQPYLTLPHYFDHIIQHIHVAACHVYNTHINNGQVVARMDKFTRTAKEVTVTRLKANNSRESNTPTTVA
jgi:hypothetical protein